MANNEITKKPFTFKDGTTVLVRPLTMEDYKVLDEWVRSEYMKNVSAALKALGAVERQTFLMTALDRVASLTFQYGLGSEILNGNAFGLCRLAYQLIENAPFSFEAFFNKIFPDNRFSEEGVRTVVDMSNLVFSNEEVAKSPILKTEPPKEESQENISPTVQTSDFSGNDEMID